MSIGVLLRIFGYVIITDNKIALSESQFYSQTITGRLQTAMYYELPKNSLGMPNSQSRVQLFPILLINFIWTLGFSIVLPFLVFLMKDFGGNAIVFGILSAIYPSFRLIGTPILGRESDTYGRKNYFF